MKPAQSLLDEQLRALSDPVRRDILQRTGLRAQNAGDIAAAYRMSRPAVSRHLRVLRAANLVLVVPRGTARYYKANLETLAEVRHWFDRFWDDGLARLKSLAEEEHHGPRGGD